MNTESAFFREICTPTTSGDHIRNDGVDVEQVLTQASHDIRLSIQSDFRLTAAGTRMVHFSQCLQGIVAGK